MLDERISLQMSLSVMQRYLPEQFLWHYEHGLVLQAIYATGKKYGRPDFAAYVKAMYDTKVQADGSILSYREGEFNLDQVNPGKNLFDLYRDSGDEKYRKAIEILRSQLRGQPRTESGGFWHKQIYPSQMWLDGIYMAQPFYARYAVEFGEESDFDDIGHQVELVYGHTRDEVSGLLYHAWDESCKQLWANPETGCSPHFWGRAMGWYCMAVLDILDYLPENDRNAFLRERLIAIANSLVKPILSVQDKESGLWYQVLDMGSRAKNYLETSASAMFVYFLFKIVRKGLLAAASGFSREEVLSVAKKGYEGLCSRISNDESGNLHLSGICSVAGLGGNPYRDGSYDYYVKEAVVSDDFKGVGPFILASLEAESL